MQKAGAKHLVEFATVDDGLPDNNKRIINKFQVLRAQDDEGTRSITITQPAHYLGARSAHNPIMFDVQLNVTRIEEEEQEFEYLPSRPFLDLTYIESIINTVAPCTVPENFQFHRALLTDLPRPDSKIKLHEPLDEAYFDITSEKRKRFPVPMRGREIKESDPNNRLNTYIIRNAINHYRFNSEEHLELFRAMQREFNKYFNPPQYDLEELLSISYAEQIDKINIKGEANQTQIADFNNRVQSHDIKVFIKTQIKADASEDSWFKLDKRGNYKAGQGISAQPKSINLLVGALVRALSTIISKSFQKFIPCYGKHPSILRKTIEQMTAGHQDCKVYSFDITQFDTLHGDWSTQFMHFVFEQCGIQSWLVGLMDDLNDLWMLKTSLISMLVKGHLQSGRADTLDKNSICALFLTLANVEITDLVAILYQGDDVTIIARHCRLTNFLFLDGAFKLESNLVGPAVGYLVADTLTIDLVQMVIKLTNRNYSATNNEEVELKQYQDAIKDRLSLLHNERRKIDCLAYNSIYHKISYQCSEALLDFVLTFSRLNIIDIEMYMCIFETHNLIVHNPHTNF